MKSNNLQINEATDSWFNEDTIAPKEGFERENDENSKLVKPILDINQNDQKIELFEELLLTTNYEKRKQLIYKYGYSHFSVWFQEDKFFNYWQLNGLLGVPLYRIRKSSWKFAPKIDVNQFKNCGNQLNDVNDQLKKKTPLSIFRGVCSDIFDVLKMLFFVYLFFSVFL